MAYSHPVVPAIQWHEGMLLSPQHFQQLEKRWEQILRFVLTHTGSPHWGVKNLKLDRIHLPTGLFRVLSVDVLFPDGLLTTYQSREGSLLEIDLTPHREEIMRARGTVYLCVPAELPNTSTTIGDFPRYAMNDGIDIVDEHAPDNVIQISHLIPKLTLQFGQVPPARHVSIPIARVAYVDASFTLLPYTAPCFSLAPETPLAQQCQSIVHRIREKAAYLSEQWQSQLGTALLAGTTAQLSPLVTVLPMIEPLLLEPTSPHKIYQALCVVAGHLSSLRLGQIPPVFPSYNHHDIAACFEPVLEWIGFILNNIEKAYDILLFNRHDRIFSVPLHHELSEKNLLIGLKATIGMSEAELEEWMKDAIITSQSTFEAARIRRITGAPRHLIQGQEMYELMPGRGVLIFRLTVDPSYIRPGEKLIIVNPTDTSEKRPKEVVLYLKNHALFSSMSHDSQKPEA